MNLSYAREAEKFNFNPPFTQGVIVDGREYKVVLRLGREDGRWRRVVATPDGYHLVVADDIRGPWRFGEPLTEEMKS